MAYPYFPATYQPIYPQYAQNQPVTAFQPQGGVNTQPMQNAPQTANNSLTWVQGVEGAKAHFVPAGASVLLMDSEAERFYIKTSDASGMPLPLRVFDYSEVKEQSGKPSQDMSGYVTREEFEQYKQSVSRKAADHEQPSIFDS